MNDNYIPEEEEFAENTVPVEEPVTPEVPTLPPESEPAEEYIPEEEIIPAQEPEPAEEIVPVEESAFEEPTLPLGEIIPEEPEIPEVPTDESFAAQYFSETTPEEFPEETFPELIREEPAVSDEEVTDIIIETLAEEALETSSEEELTSLLPVPEEALLPQEPTEEEAPVPIQQESAPKRERPARKGRPRRKKGDGLLSIPHLLSAVIWLLIIAAIGTSMGRILWVCVADVLAFGRESKEVTISITADDTLESIAENLHENGLINIPDLFLLYADITGVEEKNKITTGTFTLNTIYDYNALINHMGPRATNRVVIEDVLIPEGYSCRQIFALLEEKGICKASDLELYAANGELDDYWFLEGVERGDKYCLEGFLFPDTYDFYENSTPKLALEKMLDGFKYRFSQELQDQLPALNEKISEMMRKNGESEEYIAANQLTLRDLITVASMIEKETSGEAESARIASVIYNRLYSWGDSPRYLGIDATLIYALDGKTDLTAEDLEMDSPYNTRNHEGLTPGPITNPGLASIQAALNPEDTGYYYYVLNLETGSHVFAKTLAEHNKNVEKYREMLKTMEAQAAAEREAEAHEE